MSELCCEFCGKPVKPYGHFDTSRLIKGWEHPGRNGGSDIEWRQPLDGIAHTVCVQLEKQGISVRQETLV